MPALKIFVPEARIAEEKFDWLGAADQYVSFLKSTNVHENGKNALKFQLYLYDRIIYDYIRAAFQSKNVEQYKARVDIAISFCNEAKEKSLSAHEVRIIPPSFFEAKSLELRSWLDETPSSRREMAGDSVVGKRTR